MAQDGAESQSFSHQFDDVVAVGPEDGNSAFFGLDVLRGLVEGIEDFASLRQPRWRRYRSMGPALIGSAMWIDDPEIINALAKLSGASIVVTKQRRTPHQLEKLEQLHGLNERTPGLPIRAFAALSGLAPKVDGKPAIVGPYAPMDEGTVPTIRTLGFRKQGNWLVPIMHAKLALLGHLWWHDEGPLGHIDDVIGFTPQRLWVSSANFTRSSRRNLEVGHWTEDAALVKHAEQFLLKAMAASESLDPEADSFEPDLATVEFDDAAMAEAFADMRWDEPDNEV